MLYNFEYEIWKFFIYLVYLFIIKFIHERFKFSIC